MLRSRGPRTGHANVLAALAFKRPRVQHGPGALRTKKNEPSDAMGMLFTLNKIIKFFGRHSLKEGLYKAPSEKDADAILRMHMKSSQFLVCSIKS